MSRPEQKVEQVAAANQVAAPPVDVPGVAARVGAAAPLQLKGTNRRTVLNNCETHILDKKAHGTWDTTAMLNTLTAQFAITLNKMDRFADRLGEVMQNDELAQQAKKAMAKEAALALISVAVGPFANVAKDLLDVTYNVVATIANEGVDTALTLSGVTYNAGEHRVASLATNAMGLDGKLANAFVEKMRATRNHFLNHLASKDSLNRHIDDAIASFRPEAGEELTISEFRDSIESTVKKITSAEVRSYEEKFHEARLRIGDDLVPPKADMAIQYAGIIGKACCQLDNGKPLYDGRDYSVSVDAVNAVGKHAGDKRHMGKFLVEYLTEFKRPVVKNESYHAEALHGAFPGITQDMFHVQKDHKRTNMIVALKVLHKVAGGKPLALRTPEEKKAMFKKLLKIALATPEFNVDLTKENGKKGQKVNPLGWLLRNSEVGAELTRDIPQAELKAIVKEVKQFANGSQSRHRMTPTWRDVLTQVSESSKYTNPMASPVVVAENYRSRFGFH